MPAEGVVDALRKLHAVLVPGGIVVDTQPLSSAPPALAGDVRIGALDMSEWAGIIAAVDARVAAVLDSGLFTLESESRFTVTDRYDDGAEFLAYTREYVGTRIPPELERRAAGERRPVHLDQEIRMRLLGARAGP